MAWSARDNFDSYTSGANLGGTSGGSGWAGSWTLISGSELKTDSAPASGQGGLAAHRTGTNAGVTRRAITGISQGVVFFRMYISRTDPVDYAGVILRDSTAGRAYIKFGSAGQIQIYNGGTASYDNVQAYSVNTWYAIECEFDDSAQPDKFRIRVDGGSWTAWTTVQGSAYTTITDLDIDYSDTASTDFYVDDINPAFAPLVSDSITITENVSLLLFPNIRFDAVNTGTSVGAQASLTIAHTVTGNNPIGVVMASHDGSMTMEITGITWNGVAMTNVNNNGNTASNSNTSLWYIVNPTTGNVVISVTPNRQLYGITLSYTGAKQSGQPDASNTADDSISPYSIVTTTVANNSMVVCGIRGGTVLSASTNVTLRSAPYDTIKIGDGIQSTAGAFSQEWTDTASAETAILTISIAPATADTNLAPFVFDTVTVTEGVTLTIVDLPLVYDLATIVENVTIVLVHAPSVYDTITVSEFAEISAIILISVYENVTVSESVTLQVTEAVIVSVFDNITISESTDFFINPLLLSVSDSITVSENITLLIPILYLSDIDDVVTVETITVLIPILVPSVSDSVTIAEDYSFLLTPLNMSIVDNITATELFSTEYIIFGPQRPINRPNGFAGNLTGYTTGGGISQLTGYTTGGY